MVVMSQQKSTRARSGSRDEPPADVSFRSRGIAAPPARDQKRFDFFLVDTGWNVPVSKRVRAHLRSLFDVGGFHEHDHLYELSPQQSAVILGRAPENIGCDPTIVVYDLYGSTQVQCGGYHGFRLNLGLMRHPEQAMARLQEFTRFIAIHRTAERLDREVRRQLHREGLEGIVKVLRETSMEMLIE
jgi:hypothetical protein